MFFIYCVILAIYYFLKSKHGGNVPRITSIVTTPLLLMFAVLFVIQYTVISMLTQTIDVFITVQG